MSKKLGGMIGGDRKPTVTIDANPDNLNQFFARFEKPRALNTQPNHLPNQDNSSFTVNENDVRRLLQQIDGRKGPGPDHIIPKVLKVCAQELTTIITRLFNSSLKQQTTPIIWKTAVIKPIPKIPQPSQHKDYRPIAITSCMCKLLEKLLKNYILSVTTLDDHQFAYRPRRSTQDAVLCLLTNIIQFIDLQASNYARCLYLDFSSAFNTINVDKLMLRLSHLNSNVSNWIYSFLSARVQYTSINNVNSYKQITNTGTPQGTVLSPILFSIYTDFIRSSFSNTVIIKYADDTVILGLISNQRDSENYFSEVQSISQLCCDNDLILNATKTHEMLFTSQRQSPVITPMTVDNTAIAISSQVKYLGVLIDDKLHFSEHISKACEKASKKMYVVRRFSKYGAKVSLTKQLFSSFIESYLFYCLIIIFNHAYSTDKKQLKRPYNALCHMGIENMEFDKTLQKRTKKYIMNAYHDETHFIHNFLHKLPSGRLQTYKHRCAIGKACFLRHFILTVNDIFR